MLRAITAIENERSPIPSHLRPRGRAPIKRSTTGIVARKESFGISMASKQIANSTAAIIPKAVRSAPARSPAAGARIFVEVETFDLARNA
jgi:hypothetical protein